MAYTLNQSIFWAQTFIEYSPLTAGVNFEPAISIGTMVRNTIMNSPFTWPWNRNEFAIGDPNIPNQLTAGVQDYIFNITDFAYLEKLSLLTTDSNYGYELENCYNTNILGVASTTAQAQPNGVAVKYYTPGTNVAMRFLSNPDQDYTGIITYQKLALPFQVFTVATLESVTMGQATYTGTFNAASFVPGQTAQITGFANPANNGSFIIVSATNTTLVLINLAAVPQTGTALAVNESWYPIPDSFMDIFNNLFLAEAMACVDDGREQLYRQRGVAALLSKAEGLTEMQRNSFLAQWMSRGTSQQLAGQFRVQQGSQARGV